MLQLVLKKVILFRLSAALIYWFSFVLDQFWQLYLGFELDPDGQPTSSSWILGNAHSGKQGFGEWARGPKETETIANSLDAP